MATTSEFLAPARNPRAFERFRLVASVEALSYLLLLFVAMPLKYGLGLEMAVKVVGWAHGVLFIAYFLALWVCWQRYAWSLRTVALAALASLLPAGPFFMDSRLPRPQRAGP